MLLAGVFLCVVMTPDFLMFWFTLTHIVYDLLYKKGCDVSSKGVGLKTINTANAAKIIQSNHSKSNIFWHDFNDKPHFFLTLGV